MKCIDKLIGQSATWNKGVRDGQFQGGGGGGGSRCESGGGGRRGGKWMNRHFSSLQHPLSQLKHAPPPRFDDQQNFASLL